MIGRSRKGNSYKQRSWTERDPGFGGADDELRQSMQKLALHTFFHVLMICSIFDLPRRSGGIPPPTLRRESGKTGVPLS